MPYNIILSKDCLKITNPVIDWVACFLRMTISKTVHNVLALPINRVAILSSLKQGLTGVKGGCPAWFSLLHPYSLLHNKGVLAVLGEGDSTKVPGIDP